MQQIYHVEVNNRYVLPPSYPGRGKHNNMFEISYHPSYPGQWNDLPTRAIRDGGEKRPDSNTVKYAPYPSNLSRYGLKRASPGETQSNHRVSRMEGRSTIANNHSKSIRKYNQHEHRSKQQIDNICIANSKLSSPINSQW